MPRRVARNKIILTRTDKDGVTKRTVVKAGEPFDFTADELKSLSKDAVREPINEDEDTSLMSADELEAFNDKKAKEQEAANEAARKEAEAKSAASKAKASTAAGKATNRGADSL